MLHQGHHHPKGRGWQKNDAFAIFFSLVAISLFFVGYFGAVPLVLALGAGVTLYGWGYLLFHDILFHRRPFALLWRPTTGYIGRILYAHRPAPPA
jgi:beta-carotene 3-hydroxylase